MPARATRTSPLQKSVSQPPDCPMCGTSSSTRSPGDRKRHLEAHLRELESGQIKVSDLRGQAEEMCILCGLMMTAITSEADRLELTERIRKELAPAAPHPATPHEEGTSVPAGVGARLKVDRKHRESGRGAEGRAARDSRARREKMLDKTLADSFPTSDPPSSIPDPEADEAEDIAA